MNQLYVRKLKVAQKALEKRKRILENYENQWKYLDAKIQNAHKNEEWIEETYAEIELKHVLKRVGYYRATVSLYQINVDIYSELLEKEEKEIEIKN